MIITPESRERLTHAAARRKVVLRVVPRLDNDRFLELKPPVIQIGKLICYAKMTETELLELRDKYEMLDEFISRQLTLIDDTLAQKAAPPAS